MAMMRMIWITADCCRVASSIQLLLMMGSTGYWSLTKHSLPCK